MDLTADQPPATRVLLLGMMGSGKSSVGRALAEVTGWPFVDNDELVERATGRTARQLLAQSGEDAMRDAESTALRAGLAIPPPAIVATAAGTVLRDEDRAALRDGGFIVWLRAPASVLAERAAGGEHRPWLDDDPIGWFRAALERRDRLYDDLADIRIDTSLVEPRTAALLVVDALRASGQSRPGS